MDCYTEVIITSCDFNQDTQPYCSFTQDYTDDNDFTRNRGPTPTNHTGPSGDYPDGSQLGLHGLFIMCIFNTALKLRQAKISKMSFFCFSSFHRGVLHLPRIRQCAEWEKSSSAEPSYYIHRNSYVCSVSILHVWC